MQIILNKGTMNSPKVKINTHSPFQKLKKVLVGQSWDLSYFDFVDDKKYVHHCNKY